MGQSEQSDDEHESTDVYDESGLTSPVTWFFLTGNRLVVAGVMLVGLFALFALTDVIVGGIDREQIDPLYYTYSALTGGNFTLITIVTTITQLVISRQLGTPGTLMDEIDATTEFRQGIEEEIDPSVAPVTPTAFLHLLVRATVECVDDLQTGARKHSGEAWNSLLFALERLEGHVDAADARFSKSDVSLVRALSIMLESNYSDDIYRLRRIRERHGETFPDGVDEDLDDLIERLREIDVARQYIKTLYIQEELSKLSRQLMYVGLPAVLASVFMLRSFAVGLGTVTAGNLSLWVPVTVTAGFAPLVLLFAYVVRLAVIAEYTIAVTPFTTDDPDGGL